MAASRRRRNHISEQFAARPISMLESAPYRVLSRAAHLVMARIEIEHAHHGGNDNGRLPVTYGDFEQYGVHRRTIAPAIRELAALGFVEVTERGCAGNAEFRAPSLYRLTYRNAKGESGDGTHEWRHLKSLAHAEETAREARTDADPSKVAAGKKRNPGGRKCQRSMAKSATEPPPSPVAKSATTASPQKVPPLSISRDIPADSSGRSRSAPHGAVASERTAARHMKLAFRELAAKLDRDADGT